MRPKEISLVEVSTFIFLKCFEAVRGVIRSAVYQYHPQISLLEQVEEEQDPQLSQTNAPRFCATVGYAALQWHWQS